VADNLQLFPADETLQPFIKHIGVGVSSELIAQLVANSRQEPMLRFTPKDAAERFKDEASFHAWQAKGRTVHWLLAKDNTLAGIIWYGKSTCPVAFDGDFQPDETFAIRVYDGFSGYGLAKPFMKQSLRILLEARRASNEPMNGIWLETDDDNPSAVAVYTSFGYQEIAHNNKRLCMVLGPKAIERIAASKLYGGYQPKRGSRILMPEADNEAVKQFAELNKKLGYPVDIASMTLEEAAKLLEAGKVAAVISGAAHTSADVIKAGIVRFNPRRNTQGEVDRSGTRQLVSSYFIFKKEQHEPIVMADCAVIPNPTAEQLVVIAEQTAVSVRKIGIEPRIAFISYSTKGSAGGESAEKVAKAAKLFKVSHPDIWSIGEVQWDAARSERVYKLKTHEGYPDGKQPNVFIFPNLDQGNGQYKMAQDPDFGGWIAIGPLLQGFEEDRQWHDLSRGVTAEDLAIIVPYVAQLSGLNSVQTN
jgi:phosphotransacetylase/GNAT superfamily N-acetyltransferase